MLIVPALCVISSREIFTQEQSEWSRRRLFSWCSVLTRPWQLLPPLVIIRRQLFCIFSYFHTSRAAWQVQIRSLLLSRSEKSWIVLLSFRLGFLVIFQWPKHAHIMQMRKLQRIAPLSCGFLILKCSSRNCHRLVVHFLRALYTMLIVRAAQRRAR